ncbi:MAG: nitroreductase family protein [Dehalococcoidales bacterium]|jgi:nitroreductase|nr:nitroreductase [Dehalococcoidales bacterium]MDP6126721.1 nitroreductase family protein [Dehalococcoidales bacterium]MDP6632128.1 nitroreductase family protein [Dehalococcoidales bacterium]MDP7525925.1 nitroreductase family protein [Dehalococcoidales bacterium]|tara:strand:- start:1 stop:651 length:651 start_codon:yes stop_codon:yes gene_type:complete
MELNDLESVIKGRYSVRSWQEKDIPEELLLKAIELATWAPSGGNQQNWQFYLVMNKYTIGAMADAVQNRAGQMAAWPGADEFLDVNRVAGRVGFFRSASAVIAVTASQYQSAIDKLLEANEGKDDAAGLIRRWRNIADSRIQSVSAAIAYLLLVLHQMGIGSLWMTGPMQAKEDIEKILKVPAGLDLVALIPVGYPVDPPGDRTRKPIEEVCQVIR